MIVISYLKKHNIKPAIDELTGTCIAKRRQFKLNGSKYQPTGQNITT